MYKVNQHLKAINGKYIVPDSFVHCTGKTDNEFYAWWNNGDIIIETTIKDGFLLSKKIERWERQEKDKLQQELLKVINMMKDQNIGVETFIMCYNIIQADNKDIQKLFLEVPDRESRKNNL